MEFNNGQIRAGIDAGTAYTRCVVIEWAAGRPRLRAASVVPSQGWQGGRIRNMEAVAGCIAAAAMAASMRAGVEIKRVTAGYAEAFGQMEELSVALERGGLEVADYIPEGEAALYATTSATLREGGIGAAVIGVNTTEVAYSDAEGGMRTASIACGAQDFTESIAELLELPFSEAEHFKLNEGAIPGREESSITRPVKEVLEARAGQLVKSLHLELDLLSAPHGTIHAVILCGGGAALPGLCGYTERVLQLPVRMGQVMAVAEWPLELSSPAWATAAGLALYGGDIHAG